MVEPRSAALEMNLDGIEFMLACREQAQTVDGPGVYILHGPSSERGRSWAWVGWNMDAGTAVARLGERQCWWRRVVFVTCVGAAVDVAAVAEAVHELISHPAESEKLAFSDTGSVQASLARILAVCGILGPARPRIAPTGLTAARRDWSGWVAQHTAAGGTSREIEAIVDHIRREQPAAASALEPYLAVVHALEAR